MIRLQPMIVGVFNFMEKEIWKDIPNYEGYYQVSNLGRVKSLNFNRSKKERVLKQSIGSGYYIVCLSKDVTQKVIKVHKLVAMTFLNHISCGHEVVVDHIDNNKLNNNINNLQLISNRENCNKDKKRGTSIYPGVSWDKKYNKWVSAIRIKDTRKYLGSFHCELEAAKAYQKAFDEL